MSDSSLIAAIDKELARLREVRTLLIKSKQATAKSSDGATQRASKRRLSPEARARISEAQRKRWAAAKKGKKGQKG